MDNIFNELEKLTEEQADELLKSLGSNVYSLPRGYVTDGEGNLYKVPNVGKTKFISYNEDNVSWKYQYDWENNELDIYVLSNDDYHDDVNNYEYVTTYNISAEDFIDNPNYWVESALSSEDLKNFVDSYEVDREVEEAVDSFGLTDIDYNNPSYYYQYVIGVNSESFYSKKNIENYKNAYKDFEIEEEFLDRIISVTVDSIDNFEADYDLGLSFCIIKLRLHSDLVLTESELFDIFDDKIKTNLSYYIDDNGNNIQVTLDLIEVKEIENNIISEAVNGGSEIIYSKDDTPNTTYNRTMEDSYLIYNYDTGEIYECPDKQTCLDNLDIIKDNYGKNWKFVNLSFDEDNKAFIIKRNYNNDNDDSDDDNNNDEFDAYADVKGEFDAYLDNQHDYYNSFFEESDFERI